MKEVMARIAASSLVVSSLLFAACSILAPLPDTSHFFLLAPLPGATTPPTGGGTDSPASMLLGLGPIKLPPYLDRHEIAIRLSPTQVTYSEVDRWAEQLSVSVSRVLLQNLSMLLGTERIVMYPWSNATQVTYQIEVELLNFEATKQGETQLLARYAILEGGTRRALVVHETALSHPTAPDTAASVVTLSTTLGELSQEIATAVRQLPKPQQGPPAARKRS